jgi:hypothetical protein
LSEWLLLRLDLQSGLNFQNLLGCLRNGIGSSEIDEILFDDKLFQLDSWTGALGSASFYKDV